MAAVLDFPATRLAAGGYDPRPLAREELRATLVTALDRAFDLVDVLLARIDALDGDADFENGGDAEPEEVEDTADEWAGHGAHRFGSEGSSA